MPLYLVQAFLEHYGDSTNMLVKNEISTSYLYFEIERIGS